MTVTLTSEQIAIDRIKVDKSRKPDAEIVRQLILSIPLVGVLQPIVLWRRAAGLGIELIFGRNRLEACRKLKHRAILARVVNGDSEEIRTWCRIAEQDENQVRGIRCLPASAADVVAISAWRDKAAARA